MLTRPLPGPRPGQPSALLYRGGPLLLAILPLLPAACAPYERRDIDIGAHRAAFLLRAASDLPTPSAAPDGAACDLSDGCSVREAEILALLMNPALRVARAELGVLDARVREAGRWDDPTLAVDITRILESVAEPWELTAAVGFTLPISGRLEAERERAGAERSAEVLRVHAAEWETRLAVRAAFAERVTAERRRAELADDIARVDAVVALADRLEQTGEMSRLQARLFRIEAATRRDALLAAELRCAESELTLRSLLGLPAGAALTFDSSFPQAHRAASEELRAALLVSSHEIAIAQAEYEVAERALALEVRRQYPDLEIAPGYGRESESDRVLLGLSLPIPILNGNRQAIAEATAARSAAEARLTTLVERRSNDLERAIARHATATDRARHLATELVPLVEAQLDDARRVAELGEIDSLILLETLSRRADARLSLIDAEREAVLAAIEIDRTLGTTLMPTEPETP